MRTRPSGITDASKAFCERAAIAIVTARAGSNRLEVDRRWAAIKDETARQYVVLLLVMAIDGAPDGIAAEHLLRARPQSVHCRALDYPSWLVTRADVEELLHAHRRLLQPQFGTPHMWRHAWPRVRNNPDLPWVLADLALTSWLL